MLGDRGVLVQGDPRARQPGSWLEWLLSQPSIKLKGHP